MCTTKEKKSKRKYIESKRQKKTYKGLKKLFFPPFWCWNENLKSRKNEWWWTQKRFWLVFFISPFFHFFFLHLTDKIFSPNLEAFPHSFSANWAFHAIYFICSHRFYFIQIKSDKIMKNLLIYIHQCCCLKAE